MSVVSSELSLASSHRYSRVEATTERLEINGHTRAIPNEAGAGRAGPRPGAGAVAVMLSGEGRALAAAELASGETGSPIGKGEATADAIESAAEEARNDPGNQLLITLVEYLTGKRIQLIDSKDCQPDQCKPSKAMDSGAPEPNARPAAERGPQRGVSLHYERTHILEEHESTRFFR